GTLAQMDLRAKEPTALSARLGRYPRGSAAFSAVRLGLTGRERYILLFGGCAAFRAARPPSVRSGSASPGGRGIFYFCAAGPLPPRLGRLQCGQARPDREGEVYITFLRLRRSPRGSAAFRAVRLGLTGRERYILLFGGPVAGVASRASRPLL